MPRRAISPEEIQRALFDAAMSLFLEKGIVQTEMKEIAKRAGVSLSSLYRHAVDKNRLAFLVVASLMKELTDVLLADAARAGEESGTGRIRRLTGVILDACQARPDRLTVINEFDAIYRRTYPDIPEAKDYVILMQRISNKALQLVLDAIADGSMRHIDDPQLFSSTLMNTVFGLSLRFFPRETHFEEEAGSPGRRMVEEAIGLMLEAVSR